MLIHITIYIYIFYITNDNVYCRRHMDNWFIVDLLFQLLNI